MALVYDESVKGEGGFMTQAQFLAANPMKPWRMHYDNGLYLKFMLEKGTMEERHQASKELVICERRKRYWERHPQFNAEAAARVAAQAKKEWVA